MLLPSLYGLSRDRLLAPGLRILCTGRAEMDDAGFRRLVAAAIERNVAPSDRDEVAVRELLARVDYQPAALVRAAASGNPTGRIAAMRDGDDADWKTNPRAIVIETRPARHGEVWELALAPGGGQAIRFVAGPPAQ